jgi:hypothetical protein
VTFWQRFLARPPLRAWAVGLAPGLAIFFIVFAVSDNSGVRYVGSLVGGIVMHVVAAAVWPRLFDGNR